MCVTLSQPYMVFVPDCLDDNGARLLEYVRIRGHSAEVKKLIRVKSSKCTCSCKVVVTNVNVLMIGSLV